MVEPNELPEWVAGLSLIRNGEKSFVSRHPHFWWHAQKSDLAAIAEMPEAEEGFHVIFLKDCIPEKYFED